MYKYVYIDKSFSTRSITNAYRKFSCGSFIICVLLQDTTGKFLNANQYPIHYHNRNNNTKIKHMY